jgi:hypothetical protein
MADNIVPFPGEPELEALLRALVRTPSARARATSILREELRAAPAGERPRLVALITLLDQAAQTFSRH